MDDEPGELTPRRPASRRAESIRSNRRPRTTPAGPTALEPAAPPIEAAVADADDEPTIRLEAVERHREADDDRRRQLWRDSASILIAVILVILVGQAVFPAEVAGPAGSPTPLPSSVSIGSFGPRVSPHPPPTFGPIINPSLPIDATPTPIPVITMGPTRPPTPSPEPSPSPTRKPTPKPSVDPSPPTTPPPSVEPPPTPEITPSPPPTPEITPDPPSGP